MYPLELPGYSKNAYKDHLARLEQACEWLGVNRNRGRAGHYVRLTREFLEGNKETRQHILAYNESCESNQSGQ
jgi:hypothetical protein